MQVLSKFSEGASFLARHHVFALCSHDVKRHAQEEWRVARVVRITAEWGFTAQWRLLPLAGQQQPEQHAHERRQY